MKDEIYTFHIDAYTPATIPMARLAEYMAVLALILGEKERVHFIELQGGSTKLQTRVEREAVPKVRENIHRARYGDGRPEAVEAYKSANEMLRSDNAVASLEVDSAEVLEFPGRKIPRPPRLGPFNQAIEKDGVLVRVGGKDKSAHAILEDGDRQHWSFEVTRDLARDLAHHLFGTPLRLVGSGRFCRDEAGDWQHLSLKATAFKVLNNDSLVEVVGRIRNLPKESWGEDPVAQLRILRADDEVHG